MPGPWWGGLKLEMKRAEGEFDGKNSLIFGKRFYILSRVQAKTCETLLSPGEEILQHSLDDSLEDEILLQANNPPLLPLAPPAPTLPTHGPGI